MAQVVKQEHGTSKESKRLSYLVLFSFLCLSLVSAQLFKVTRSLVELGGVLRFIQVDAMVGEKQRRMLLERGLLEEADAGSNEEHRLRMLGGAVSHLERIHSYTGAANAVAICSVIGLLLLCAFSALLTPYARITLLGVGFLWLVFLASRLVGPYP